MSSFDAVEYLVLRMFPAKLVHQARLDIGEGELLEQAEAYIEKVGIYERALRALSDESLMAMVEDERQQDAALAQERVEQLDRHRFFNDSIASANFARWAKRPCWTLDAATALILGKNPEIVNWANIEPLIGVSPFATRFADIRRHLTHVRENGQLLDPVSPAHFLTWAHERGVVLLDTLEGCINDRQSQTLSVPVTDQDDTDAITETAMISDDDEAGSRDAVKDHAARSDRTGEPFSEEIICFTREKSRLRVMSERMRAANERTAEIENDLTGDASDALVKMTIAMAIGRYGFDPESGRNSTITDIVRDLEKVGLSLSPTTIRKWLCQASACLPDSIDEAAKTSAGGSR